MGDRTAPDVFAQAANHVSELVNQIIANRGKCLVVVSGGSAIQHTLGHLATCDVPWSAVRLYIADERCVPREDRHRNDAMISEVLVRPARIKSEYFFPIPAELGPHQGAQMYGQTLVGIDRFDIALLGVGPDGHVASLFPHHASIESSERVVAVENSPKFPPNRVSVGLVMLGDATHRIVLVIGDEKRDLINRLQGGERPPVALVNPTKWFLDSSVSELGSL
jgi:6-phosphogluconolactonase